MKWKSVLCFLSFFNDIVVFCAVQLCSKGQVCYTPTSCLEVRRTQPKSNTAAQSNCMVSGLTGLVTIEREGQFEALKSFVEVLLKGDELLWLGYYYNADGNVLLRRTGDVTNSDVFGVEQNFMSGGTSPGDGVCIAIGRDGLFRRITCTEPHSYACYQDHATSITSLEVSPSRFLMEGASTMATLSCQYQPADATVMWRHNNTQISDMNAIATTSGQSNLTISPFMQASSGSYECVVSNSVGGVVSKAIVLVPDPDGVDVPAPTITSIDISSPINSIQNGSSVMLTCNSNDTSASYEWFFNGNTIPSAVSRTYTISNFQTGGFYQCRASLSSGENDVFTVRLDPLVLPGADDTISAMPLNRTSILVSWLSPVFPRDPLLLRYSLFYTSGSPSLDPDDYSTAQSVSDILPTLRNGSVSQEDVVEHVLSGLQVGTEYSISVRASFRDLDAPNSIYIAKSSTYGQAPSKQVEGLTVYRTPNNKSLLATWSKFVSEPPTGEIVFYEVEYRNQGKDVSMAVRIAAFYDFFSILEVENASAYEVRVRAGVQVSRDPPVYEFNEPTEWELANKIVPSVPSPPPTVPLRPQLGGGEIAAIVVCICVAFLVALILIVGVIAYIFRSRQDDDKGQSHESQPLSTPTGAEAKAMEASEKESSPVTSI